MGPLFAETVPQVGPDEMAWMRGLMWLLIVAGILDRGISLFRRIFGMPEKAVPTEIANQPLSVQKHEPAVPPRDFHDLRRRVEEAEKEIRGIAERIAVAGERRAEKINQRIDSLSEKLATLTGVIEQANRQNARRG